MHLQSDARMRHVCSSVSRPMIWFRYLRYATMSGNFRQLQNFHRNMIMFRRCHSAALKEPRTPAQYASLCNTLRYTNLYSSNSLRCQADLSARTTSLLFMNDWRQTSYARNNDDACADRNSRLMTSFRITLQWYCTHSRDLFIYMYIHQQTKVDEES